LVMAQINPAQDYDLIATLKFAEPKGDCHIYLHRGSFATASGTVYYRPGDGNKWNELTVKGDKTVIPVSDYVMQVGLNWDKDGDNYTTPSFRNNSNLTEITFSQKSILQGRIGNYFFYFFAYNCPNLVVLDVPDVSKVTEVGGYFMVAYAQGVFPCARLPTCRSLTSWVRMPDSLQSLSVEYPNHVYFFPLCERVFWLDFAGCPKCK
jgi:hypothetical protein